MSDLMYLYQHRDVFIIIFVRIVAALALLPIIEETKMPRIALAGFALGITVSVFFRTDVAKSYYEPNVVSYSVLLIKEMIVGLTLGFVVKLFFQIYPFVGSLLSMQGGLSMSVVMDPTSGMQATQLGRLYNLGLAVVFIQSGGYHWFIQTLVESFDLIPIGKVVFTNHIAMGMVETMSVYFELGLKLSMPIVGVILIIDFAMGILARTVPQMNMFVVGIPIKMIILFVLLIMTLSTISDFNQIIIDRIVQTVNAVIAGMRGL